MTYSLFDGPTAHSPSGPFEDPKRDAPVGPFRRRDADSPRIGPGFGLLAIDPEFFARGHRRLKLRYAAMATGAFAMMSMGIGVQPPTTAEVPRKPPRAEDTAELKKPTKRTDGDDALDDAKDIAAAAGALAVARATEPDNAPASDQAVSDNAGGEASEPAPSEQAPAPWQAAPIAEYGGVNVFEISDQIQLVGFHEAAYNVALPLTPVDPPSANHGRSQVNYHQGGHKRSAEVIVLPTRLRESNPASAIDIAVKAGTPILSPVDGIVTAVLPYSLYNKYPDYRIEIAPAGHPELQLTVLHVSGPLVNVGDTLVAGQTPFAQQATLFPFESQIDRFSKAMTGAMHPHVHMEFKYR